MVDYIAIKLFMQPFISTNITSDLRFRKDLWKFVFASVVESYKKAFKPIISALNRLRDPQKLNAVFFLFLNDK
jgi:hypothetical protein